MKKGLFFIVILCSFNINAQDTLSELLKKYNDNSVLYISAEALAMPKTKAVLLDAREPREFEVSHLKKAINVGYDHFNLDSITALISNKNENIVVYCSLGIRSETIAKRLKSAGYKNVFNLYGGIFEWKNKNFPIYNSEEKETENIHVFSDAWSKWVTKGEKIYE